MLRSISCIKSPLTAPAGRAKVRLQRQLPPPCISRDIGTVIFPDAEVKIFLTASAENRAERRFRELRDRGVDADYRIILEEIKTRDHNDSTRAISPLKQAEDAVLLDNTGFTLEESVNAVMKLIDERLEGRPDYARA